ncbi:hypothetical protein BMS3Abin09_01297 [bacterium BMS3Abin09]|nr:hypothetical protein BMS3Abin09_01297 [bacterium BMS3Abin09]
MFQENTFIDLDYQTQEIICYTKQDGNVRKEIKRPEEKEPLKEQLISFIDCIRNNKQPIVSGQEGREALKVVLEVSDLVRDGLKILK